MRIITTGDVARRKLEVRAIMNMDLPRVVEAVWTLMKLEYFLDKV